ncbi:MAG: DUF1016 N-terminal domain-containing protein [Candidatus Omnitrophica bacterium]|nr:DUF1016 N-terminal domain-containing protein [Candidatus Omnitrophota bacterium]MDD5670504.1 DUF1016 N-terminal domain-containing protein [Candidatus Omnitrophota bacterium]
MARLKRLSVSGLWIAPAYLFLTLSALSIPSGPVCAGDADVGTYDQLLGAIRRTRADSQARIESAAEQEKVRVAWETGKLIDEHVLRHRERADYDKEVMKRLAKDLGASDSELYRMLQFVRIYPIVATSAQLSWGHYRELLAVKDDAQRKSLEERAEKEHWPVAKLREVIRKEVGPAPDPDVPDEDPSELPEINPGPLDTYQIIRLKDRLVIDLGFGIYRELPEAWAGQYGEGSIVKVADGKLGKAGETVLYTYRAQVTGVVDGDTFHALVDLGFETTAAERVRLRRVDAPELVTAAGKEAKDYLEKILRRDGGRIVMQSRELDQHGRSIADVWVQGRAVDRELAEQGLAEVVEQ